MDVEKLDSISQQFLDDFIDLQTKYIHLLIEENAGQRYISDTLFVILFNFAVSFFGGYKNKSQAMQSMRNFNKKTEEYLNEFHGIENEH